jgi:hypothetical protein
MNDNTENPVSVSDERMRERLRQERETFDQHKTHENRWFTLRLVMGYSSVLLLLAVMGISSYILLNHALFPAAVITSAGAALFVDVLGLLVAVWKIVFNPDFMTKLAPVTQVRPSDTVRGNITVSPATNKVSEELTILSATYGMGNITIDVTKTVKSKVSAGQVRFLVCNTELGGDPLKGVRKELKVIYSHAGKTLTKIVTENEELLLP